MMFKLGSYLQKYWLGMLGFALCLAIFSLAYCKGHDAGKNGEVIAEQERTIELQNELATAAAQADKARLEDVVTIAEQKEILNDAVKAGLSPDDLRARRGCLVMRQQGRDTSRIAACRGFEAGN